MKQYICLSPSPWQAVPTRTQQLMTRLRDAEVLFFEPPSPRGRGARDGGRRVRPGLTVYSLPPVLQVDERHGFLFSRGVNKTARFITAKMDRHRFREPILWTTCPDQVHLLDSLPFRGLVYDCDRYWSGFPLEWESDLALSADVIFAASQGLIDHLSPCNDNIALLPNGVNFPMFARQEVELPGDLASIPRPILGWAGTVRRDLDLSPLLQAASELPRCSFVLVGKIEGSAQLRRLSALPNVHLLGPKAPVDLPDYLCRFDVCLNLLSGRELPTDIIPSRIYEYLSTGNPIVSMIGSGQIEHFPDVIYGAHTAREFSQLCASALTEVGSWTRCRRRDYGAAAAWSVRADEVCRILDAIGLC